MATNYRHQRKPPYPVLLHPRGPHFVQGPLKFENLEPSADAKTIKVRFSRQGDTTLDVPMTAEDLDLLIQRWFELRDAGLSGAGESER